MRGSSPKSKDKRTKSPETRYDEYSTKTRSDVAKSVQKSSEELEAIYIKIPILVQRVINSIQVLLRCDFQWNVSKREHV